MKTKTDPAEPLMADLRDRMTKNIGAAGGLTAGRVEIYGKAL
jgi:hypothetical protein